MSLRAHITDLRPLRSSRPFLALWAGTSLAGLGSQIASVAALAQVWELTKSPVWTGTLGLASGVAMLAFGPLGGSLADRLDRRAIVRLSTAGQAVAALALTAQAALGLDSVPLLLALIAVQSAAGAFGAPARRTLPPRLLPAGEVAAGLALQNLAFQGSMLAGPAIGGLLVAWSLPVAYAAEAIAIGVSLLCLLALPALPPQLTPAAGSTAAARGARRGPRAERGAWTYVLRRPTLWGAFAVDLAATVLAMPIALFPLVNEERFGGDPRTLGLFLSAIAVGGIVAGALSGTVTRARRSGLLQLAAAAVWGVALAGFGLAGPLWLALACLAVAGAADTVSVVTRGALVQLETPDGFRGRVSAVEHVIGVACPQIGNFRGGMLGGLVGAPIALAIGGLTATAAVLVVGAVNRPLRTYRMPDVRVQPDLTEVDREAGLLPGAGT
ncbi:MFS transporter [Leifsonia sp. NPDC058194]|uniref:MFS transporter n=1 Tax=Leifsonia sp. NPDC058194 TaxID=3346374 RepID=UPI0036DC49CF